MHKKTVFRFLEVTIVFGWLVILGLWIRQNVNPTLNDLNFGDGKNLLADSERQDWREIYLQNKKLGYAVSRIKPFKNGYFIQEEMFLRFNAMGMANGMKSVTQSYVDEKFFLKEFLFNVNSGAVRFQVTGKVEADRLIVTSGRGRKKTMQVLALAQPPMLATSLNYFFKTRPLQIGERIRVPLFDPSTLSQKEASFVVKTKEELKMNQASYRAFRLETEWWGQSLKIWIDEQGEILKEEGMMGLSTIKSNAADVSADIDEEALIDFYEFAAVQPDKIIAKVSKVGYLKLKIEGPQQMQASLSLFNSDRQKYENPFIEIKREKIPQKASYDLPYKSPASELASFLRPELNIESDDPDLVAKAREIIGTEDNPIVASRKLLNWVYDHIEKRPVMSIPSARETLRTRIGDCNEHAILLTALLRAAGIPARLSTGLVSIRNRFFYHAWTEAFLGTWISMDATLNQMPVDATHVKMAEGNLGKQAELAGLIGELKIKIIEYHYD